MYVHCFNQQMRTNLPHTVEHRKALEYLNIYLPMIRRTLIRGYLRGIPLKTLARSLASPAIHPIGAEKAVGGSKGSR